MILIDARCVLFNMLLHKDSLDLCELQSFAEKIKCKHNDSYIDISEKGILGAIETCPSVLSLQGNIVSKKESYGKFGDIKFLNDTINREFSKELQASLTE